RWYIDPNAGSSSRGGAFQAAGLNRGSDKSDTESKAKWYFPSTVQLHGATARQWGPSAAHPSVVIHGYADGHADPVDEQIDPNAYLYQITRAGREITPQN